MSSESKGRRRYQAHNQLVRMMNKIPPLVSIFLGIIMGLGIARLWFGEVR